jgi:hypothetical protein
VNDTARVLIDWAEKAIHDEEGHSLGRPTIQGRNPSRRRRHIASLIEVVRRRALEPIPLEEVEVELSSTPTGLGLAGLRCSGLMSASKRCSSGRLATSIARLTLILPFAGRDQTSGAALTALAASAMVSISTPDSCRAERSRVSSRPGN